MERFRPGRLRWVLSWVVLAVVLGAAAAVVTLFHYVVGQPLRVPNADQVVTLAMLGPAPRAYEFSEGEFSFLAHELERSLGRVAVAGLETAAIETHTGALSRPVAFVSPSYFEILGVHAWRGRTFTLDDHTQPTATIAAIISHELWRTQFAREGAGIGHRLKVGHHAAEIVGVLPPGLVTPDLQRVPAVFLPLSHATVVLAPSAPRPANTKWLRAVARIDPPRTFEVTRAALATSLKSIAIDPASMPTLVAARDVMLPAIDRARLWDAADLTWLTTVAVVLLGLAGVWIATIFELESRRFEMIVRHTCGATRRSLFVHLVQPFAVRGLVASVAALGIAQVALQAAVKAVVLPGRVAMEYVDVRLAPAAIATVIGAILLCWVPASVMSFRSAMRSANGSWSLGIHRAGGRVTAGAGRPYLIGMTALCVFFCGMGVFYIRGVSIVINRGLGYSSERMVVATVDLANRKLPNEQVGGIARMVRDRLSAAPDLRSVAMVVPAGGSTAGGEIVVNGKVMPSPGFLGWHLVDNSYFEALALRRRAGRFFGPADGPDAPGVTVISASLARRLFPGGDALGSTIANTDAGMTTVIGVTDDIVLNLTSQSPLAAYLSADQQIRWFRPVVRFIVDADSPQFVSTALIRALADEGYDRERVTSTRTIGELVRTQFSVQVLASQVLGAVTMVALACTAVSAYVLVFGVLHRYGQTLAIMNALGASRFRLAWHCATAVLVPLAVGSVLGCLGMWFGTRVVRGQLPGVESVDALAAASVALIISLCVAGLSWVWIFRRVARPSVRLLYE